MKRLIYLALILLYPLSPLVEAQYPSLGNGAALIVNNAAIEPGTTDVQFEGGVTIAPDTADFNPLLSMSPEQSVTIGGTIKVPTDNAHFGKTADIFAVGFYSPVTRACSGKSEDGQYYMLVTVPVDNANQDDATWYDSWDKRSTRAKTFEEWDGSLDSLKPFQTDVALNESIAVPIITNSKFPNGMQGLLCINFGYRVTDTNGTNTWVFNDNTVNVTFIAGTILIESNLASGDKITVPSSGIEIQSIADTDVAVKVSEDVDEEGDKIFWFEIEGGDVEINLPDPNLEDDTNQRLSKARSTRQADDYIIDKSWVLTKKMFLQSEDDFLFVVRGKNRVPESKQYKFSTKSIVNDARKTVFALAEKVASELRSSCYDWDTDCFQGKEPVLFVHGYTPSISGLGGGKGTWGNFPRLLQDLGYVPFEFRWRTAARFEDVANELGTAVNLIQEKTGRQIHIIAHSFGGLLTRTWLQGLASNDSTPKADSIVAGFITLGTPHSGVADNDQCVLNTPLPAGQDVRYPIIHLDDFFEGCNSLTCHEAGESILGELELSDSVLQAFKNLRSTFEVGEPGELIVELADFSSNPLPNVNILVQIGLNKSEDSSFWNEGDGLITFKGQRFLPDYTVTGCTDNQDVSEKNPDQPLKNSDEVSNGRLTEVILGLDATVRPGDFFGEDFNGYKHSGGEAFVTCNTATGCEHHGFKNTVQWLKDHPSFTTDAKTFMRYSVLIYKGDLLIPANMGIVTGPLQDNEQRMPIEIRSVDEFRGIGAVFLEVPFQANKTVTFSVEVPGYKTHFFEFPMENSPQETLANHNIDTPITHSPIINIDKTLYSSTDLPTVTGLEAVYELGGEIKLSWNPVEGADYYNVYLCHNDCLDGDYNITDQPTSPVSYYFIGTSKYARDFRVTAVVDSDPNDGMRDDESQFSDIVLATPEASTPSTQPEQPEDDGQETQPTPTEQPEATSLNAPTNLSATKTGVEQIVLFWTPVEGATAYKIYWKVVGMSQWQFLQETTVPNFIHTGVLSPNETYFYRVTAVASDGTTESEPSEEASATPQKSENTDQESQATTTPQIIAISTNGHYTCALTASGGVKCWGSNFIGQLGDGTEDDSSTPVDVIGLDNNVQAISTGNFHTCALTTHGGVKCWGYNSSGQLGNETTENSLTPVDVVGLTNGVQAISLGRFHTCVLTTNGGVKCWGYNSSDQLGDETTKSSLTPVDVIGLTSNVQAISAGGRHTCALTTNGGMKCWGDNTYGQLGDETTEERLTPVDVVGLTSDVQAISAGVWHTCALTTNGGMKCWGSNSYGQLGNETTENSLTPVDVVGLTSNVQAISAGGGHTCALTTNGGMKCWGFNSVGQLGDETTENSLTPVDVVRLTNGVQAISTGLYYSCALTINGGVKCWGYRAWSPRDGTTTDSSIVNVKWTD